MPYGGGGLSGCIEWQKTGLAPPLAIVNAVKEYRDSEDDFKSWLDERCILDESFSARACDLIASFKEYSGWKTIKPKKFAQLLRAKGFEPGKSSLAKWHGLTLG